MSRRRPRRTYRLPEEQMRHVVGVAAHFTGDCARCPEPILKGDRVVQRRDGWIHARCHGGGDE